MKTKFYNILILSSLLIFSCSKDGDDAKSEEKEQSFEEVRQNSCDDENGLKKFTECCVEGPLMAIPEYVFSATYTTNIENPIYSWKVLGGSIELIEGGNSATAKFRTKNNFVRDTIVGQSHSVDGLGCSDLIVITSNNN